MTTKLAPILLTIAATAAVASADVDQPQSAPPHKASSANVITVGVARVIEDQHDRKALSLEGLHRLGTSRSHVHAMLAFSERDSEQAGLVSGRFDQIRVGVEVGQHLRMRATLDAPMTVGDAVAEVGLGVSLAAGVGF